jgi:hypothetical protein
MKRFKISNKNGLKFEIVANELVMQPEHGKPERWVNEDGCSDDDKLAALESRPIPESEKVEYRLPAEFVVVEEDMTAELADKVIADANQEQVRLFLKGLKKSDLTTIDACASAIMKIVKHIRADQ